ncbi:hypothetical protein TNCV_2799491 [Trichonephila clavipes]|nr:hypothetical protein TNCV_2799491 [Trichonephila clavipes]
MTILIIRSSTVATDISYTSDFRWPRKQMSKGLRSVKSEDQATGPPCRIHLPGYVTRRWMCTALEKYAEAPPCMNPTFLCAMAVTRCSNDVQKENQIF